MKHSYPHLWHRIRCTSWLTSLATLFLGLLPIVGSSTADEITMTSPSQEVSVQHPVKQNARKASQEAPHTDKKKMYGGIVGLGIVGLGIVLYVLQPTNHGPRIPPEDESKEALAQEVEPMALLTSPANDIQLKDLYIPQHGIDDLPWPQDKGNLIILILTGALHPCHTEHIANLIFPRRVLGARGYPNIQCVLVPSGESYVKGKYKNKEHLYIPYAKRHKLATILVGSLATHKLITQEEKQRFQVSKIEDSPTFKDFTVVCKEIEEQNLNATVVYCCGQDHFEKCIRGKYPDMNVLVRKRVKKSKMSSSGIIDGDQAMLKTLEAVPEYLDALKSLPQLQHIPQFKSS